METTLSFTKTCQCGCGQAVTRRFRPGHDARLKSHLVTLVSSPHWWERENAARALQDLGWLHFTQADRLAAVAVRSRARNGRYTETRHVAIVEAANWTHLDEQGTTHSHPCCPDTQGTLQAERQITGWLCSTCVHVTDWMETAAHHLQDAWEVKTAKRVVEWDETKTSELAEVG